LEQVLAWSVDRIHVTTAALTLLAEQGAAESGVTAVSHRDRVGHVIGIRPRAGVRTSLLAALSGENIYVSIRDRAIRVAPHVYNTEADILRLLAVLHADAERS
jgi:selenocysteine lyase/cysteine desulfurase